MHQIPNFSRGSRLMSDLARGCPLIDRRNFRSTYNAKIAEKVDDGGLPLVLSSPYSFLYGAAAGALVYRHLVSLDKIYSGETWSNTLRLAKPRRRAPTEGTTET